MKTLALASLSVMFVSLPSFALDLPWTCSNAEAIGDAAGVVVSDAVDFGKAALESVSPHLASHSSRLAREAHHLAVEAELGASCWKLRSQYAEVADDYADLKLAKAALEAVRGPLLLESTSKLAGSMAALEAEVRR